MGTTLLFAILTKNASFRSYGTFAYLLRAHIRNINMCGYIASASARGRELSGRELSGRVRADAYNFAVLCSGPAPYPRPSLASQTYFARARIFRRAHFIRARANTSGSRDYPRPWV